MIRERTVEPERGIRLARRGVTLWLALLSAFVLGMFIRAPGSQPDTQERADVSSLFSAVVAEVKELGRHPGEDFYRWEFFLGEDDDDTNKDIHAVVIIQDDPPPLRLRIHITDLERLPGNSRVRIARRTRVLFAARVGDRMTVEKCDYPEKELVPVLQSLLKAIRDKKKLLR